ncbi:MAG: acyl-CoA dehydrogenase [Betaproteobacteria bacterium]|nr:acyl-CoA dehydrogenase [Betaproteobacteria bacterium]
MGEYAAPLKDMQFVLEHVVGLDQVNTLPGCDEVTQDVVDAILEEAAKFAGEVLSPLNAIGDKVGATFKDGEVTTPPGFKEAYRQFVEGGWGSIITPPEFGGQGLPHLLSTPIEEMWGSANIAFKLCPMLTVGAIEALHSNASSELKQRFLPHMVSGQWTGTMNLTEPQAGSDLSLVRAKAVPQADGTFGITGQKIFITYGEQDYTENIVHAVLARIEGAPEGVKGISLFVVPKVLVKADGSLGERNSVKCVSIEHKMGIHASPTAVMAYDNATGHLVGEANRGLEYMFVMMNAARLGVGLEGVSLSERAYQRARDWAKDRLQGRPVGVAGAAKTAPIIQHPDVKRMLLTMKASAEATRALAYQVSALLDRAHRHPDDAERRHCQTLVDLLIPVVKGWSTETAIEVASLGIQVHGGMGFIEETGAAQYLRDARISTIYEGTTGIQANDLVGRKVGREAGVTMKALIVEMRGIVAELAGSDDAELRVIGGRQAKALDALERATDWIVTVFPTDPGAVAAGSVYYLKLCGLAIGGWMMARAAVAATKLAAAGQGDAEFLRGKRLTARFYADHFLPQVDALAETFVSGGQLVRAAEEALL